MPTSIRRSCVTALSSAVLASTAHAAVIFDTGPVVDSAGFAFLIPAQRLAGQFSTSSTVTLGAAQAWMRASSGSADFVIYRDDGNAPDAGNELLRHSFVLPTSEAFGWLGPCNLPPLELSPGTYWIALETSDAAADVEISVDNRLARYASALAPTFTWNSYPGENGNAYGFRGASSCGDFQPAAVAIPAMTPAGLLGLLLTMGGIAGFLLRPSRRVRP